MEDDCPYKCPRCLHTFRQSNKPLHDLRCTNEFPKFDLESYVELINDSERHTMKRSKSLDPITFYLEKKNGYLAENNYETIPTSSRNNVNLKNNLRQNLCHNYSVPDFSQQMPNYNVQQQQQANNLDLNIGNNNYNYQQNNQISNFDNQIFNTDYNNNLNTGNYTDPYFNFESSNSNNFIQDNQNNINTNLNTYNYDNNINNYNINNNYNEFFSNNYNYTDEFNNINNNINTGENLQFENNTNYTYDTSNNIDYFSSNLTDLDLNNYSSANYYNDNYGRLSGGYRPPREANIYELSEFRTDEEDWRMLPGKIKGIVTLNDYRSGDRYGLPDYEVVY